MPLAISWPDLKLSARLLRKYAGLTFVASFGIAVGIGISAGALAFFYSHLYPKVPLDEGDRIVALENWRPPGSHQTPRFLCRSTIGRGLGCSARERLPVIYEGAFILTDRT